MLDKKRQGGNERKSCVCFLHIEDMPPGNYFNSQGYLGMYG